MSMENEITDLLKKHNLSVTENRCNILTVFKNHDGALNHADIEKAVGGQFDRVTIYRTLQTFMEKGIIHAIPTTDNSVLYALCPDGCSSSGHQHDNHIHFICDECQTTYCLEDAQIPAFKLPQGFKAKQTDVIVSGRCDRCTFPL